MQGTPDLRLVVLATNGFSRRGRPQTGYIPLLALERPRLSVREVAAVVRSLVIRGVLPIEVTDIWAAITEIIDDMPSRRR
jgi:hypothetical protein